MSPDDLVDAFINKVGTLQTQLESALVELEIEQNRNQALSEELEREKGKNKKLNEQLSTKHNKIVELQKAVAGKGR